MASHPMFAFFTENYSAAVQMLILSPVVWGTVECSTGPLLALYIQKQLSQEKNFPLLIQSYMQEGLSPNHLKKAKLMFFYTRYPSSNMLKTYFSDVKVRKYLPPPSLSPYCMLYFVTKWYCFIMLEINNISGYTKVTS